MKTLVLAIGALMMAGCATVQNGELDVDAVTVKESETLEYLATAQIAEIKLVDADFDSVLRKMSELTNGKCIFVYALAPDSDLMAQVMEKKMNVIFRDILMSDFVRIVSLHFNLEYHVGAGWVHFGPAVSLCGGVNTAGYKVPRSQIKNISAFKNRKALNPDCAIPSIAYDEKDERLWVMTENLELLKIVVTLIEATKETSEPPPVAAEKAP